MGVLYARGGAVGVAQVSERLGSLRRLISNRRDACSKNIKQNQVNALLEVGGGNRAAAAGPAAAAAAATADGGAAAAAEGGGGGGTGGGGGAEQRYAAAAKWARQLAAIHLSVCNKLA